MKASGGWRPIGLFCSLYRWWGRCRRCFALEWELNHQRSFYAGQAFASASDAVWRQSFMGEAGIAQGQVSATLLWDISKPYEAIRM
eukprot:8881631-Pyramimonas_sp.AAC.1